MSRPASAASSVEKIGPASLTASELLHDADPLAPPTLPELHLAAQNGDAVRVHELLESGAASPDDRDVQGITALHWAAINNRLLACKELLISRAPVDAVGGELQATALQWAARNGHVDICHLLIAYGADPALVDSQGFNTLHLAVHSSSPLLLLYILAAGLPVAVDSADGAGRTALMWAAYQGDGISVELLLKFGASTDKQDPTGLSALHWAVVKGNVNCISRIVSADVDLSLRTSDTKLTAYELSKQLNSTPAYNRALQQLQRDPPTGRHKRASSPLSERQTKIALWILPGLVLGVMFHTCDLLPWYTSIPLVGAEFYGMHHVVIKVLLEALPGDPNSKVQKSPYLAGLLAGSIFWVGYAWLTTLVRATSSLAFTNLAFAVFFTLCSYNFWRAVSLDPGFIPQYQSNDQMKEVIEDMVQRGQFTAAEFCLSCLIRRPMRSKHCRLCDRCTARHDHHCPWIYNDVAVQNHRQFYLFVLTLILGIITFDRLAIAYFMEKTPREDELPDANLADAFCFLPRSVCLASHFDGFIFSIMLWASLQLTWTLLVCGGQSWQIIRQLTTYELSNLGRYGYMGGKGGESLAAQQNHPATRLAQSQAGEHSGCEHHGHGHGHQHAKAGRKLWTKCLPNGLIAVLGLDLYTKGRGADGLSKSASTQGKRQNPFDLGIWRNCTDFWSRGKTLDVDYMQLYELPEGGFQSYLAGRKQSVNSKDKDKERGLRRSGYEMLRNTDEA